MLVPHLVGEYRMETVPGSRLERLVIVWGSESAKEAREVPMLNR